jgi:hypothetical protein
MTTSLSGALLDILLVTILTGALALALYYLNSKWYNSKKTSVWMQRISFVAAFMAFLAAKGSGASLIGIDAIILTTLKVFAWFQLFLIQPMFLLGKVIYWLSSRYRKEGGGDLNIKRHPRFNFNGISREGKLGIYIALGLFVLSVIVFQLVKTSLTDCEKNFIEGAGLSKSAYSRIQDGNRQINFSESKQMAAAIPGGDFETNIRRVLLAIELSYDDCLEASRVMTKYEEDYLRDTLMIIVLRVERLEDIIEDLIEDEKTRLAKQIEIIKGHNYSGEVMEDGTPLAKMIKNLRLANQSEETIRHFLVNEEGFDADEVSEAMAFMEDEIPLAIQIENLKSYNKYSDEKISSYLVRTQGFDADEIAKILSSYDVKDELLRHKNEQEEQLRSLIWNLKFRKDEIEQVYGTLNSNIPLSRFRY